MMGRTFEERIADKIDGLYQGCLFLRGGDAPAAERLLVSSTKRAFHEHTPGITGAEFDRWLDGRLVDSFLEGSHDERAPEVRARGDLFQAALAVPAWSRAALWLVVLRRWSYRDAAAALGLDRAGLVALLNDRGKLMSAMRGLEFVRVPGVRRGG